MDRWMDGGRLNQESDGERDRLIGSYTQMQPARQTDTGRQFTNPVQSPTDRQTEADNS
jgi:hypothetical protein